MSPRRPVLFTFVALLSLLGTASGASAAVRWHRGLQGPPSTRPATVVAQEYVAHHAGRLGLKGVGLSAEARVIPWRGHQIVRFGQTYEGLPVFGRVVVVRLDRAGSVRTVVSNANRSLDVVPESLVSTDEATGYAAAPFGVAQLGAPSATLGIYDDGLHGLLAWRVEASWNLRRWRIFVDALTGEVIFRRSLATGAEGRVYLENPVSTPSTTLATLSNLPATETHLNGDWVTVFHYVDGNTSQVAAIEDLTLDQTAVADVNGDFDYQPTTDASAHFDDPFTEVNAYYHLDDMYTYFRDNHGYTTNRRVVSIANMGTGPGQPYENAYFTPVQWNGAMAYGLFLGQAATVDLGYDGDVIRHEFTHSVVHDLTNMGYGTAVLPVYDNLGANTGPGAIHEGMADFFACTVTDDPVLGEYSLAAMGGGQRNQQNNLTCPDNVEGEGHDDGEVWGGTVWEIRTTLGDATLTDSMLYGGLATLASNATFQDYAFAVQDAAAAMVGDGDLTQAQADTVDSVLGQRGMLSCGRALDMTGGATKNLINAYTYGTLAGMAGMSCDAVRGMGFPPLPLLFQFKMSVPANATAISFEINFTPSDDVKYDIYIRRGDHVGFQMVSVLSGFFNLPEPITFDSHFGPLTAGTQTVTLGEGGALPLEPGGDYYFAVVNQNCDQGTVTVTTDQQTGTTQPDGGVSDDGAVTPDGGTGDDNPKDGCGCTNGGSTPPPLGLGLLLLVAGWIVRRRRR